MNEEEDIANQLQVTRTIHTRMKKQLTKALHHQIPWMVALAVFCLLLQKFNGQ